MVLRQPHTALYSFCRDFQTPDHRPSSASAADASEGQEEKRRLFDDWRAVDELLDRKPRDAHHRRAAVLDIGCLEGAHRAEALREAERVESIVAVLDRILGGYLEGRETAKSQEQEREVVEQVAVEERGRAAVGEAVLEFLQK